MSQVAIGIRECAQIMCVAIIARGIDPQDTGRLGPAGDVAERTRSVVKGGIEPRYRVNDDIRPGGDHVIHRIRQLRLSADLGQTQCRTRRHLVNNLGDIGTVCSPTGARSGVIRDDEAGWEIARGLGIGVIGEIQINDTDRHARACLAERLHVRRAGQRNTLPGHGGRFMRIRQAHQRCLRQGVYKR